MKLIAGLGNPGKEYENTRHNAGYKVIDALADDYGIEVIKAKHNALIGDKIINGEKIILAKPLTFMNLSGNSVCEILNYYKIEAEDLIVIYDDTTIDNGGIRIRERGGHGGHNGMKSIIGIIGSDFTRIRIGIGSCGDYNLSDYVLSKIPEEAMASLDKAAQDAVCAVKLIIDGKIETAMNRYNIRRKQEKEETDE